jgi:hypothetical protein
MSIRKLIIIFFIFKLCMRAAIHKAVEKFKISPVENGEIINTYLDSFRNRLSNSRKFTDIDRYRAGLYGASFLANIDEEKREMKPPSVVRSLILKGLRLKEIKIELTNMYGDEALLITAVKKWLTCFMQGEQSSEMAHDRQGH